MNSSTSNTQNFKRLPTPHSPLRPLLIAGTGSDVGKSVIAAAICRILVQDGYHPAPFKAQNMALNSFATPDGLEIGRAQAVQAEACRLAPHTDMNPLLLKPCSDCTTQVVLNGSPIGNRSAYEYFRKEGREELRQQVHAAYDRLSAQYNPIVMEGAGSISELNLMETDLVNMPMARYADADVILVADIDRGGVFASCYGSIMLQTPDDRRRIKGIIINKFRGDIRLFEDGRKMIERLCGVPVLGVVPMFRDIAIDEEDSVQLQQKHRSAVEGKINVAVVLLRHMSNFTDFSPLERDSSINLFYTDRPDDMEQADIIILPGTKSTLDDLYLLRRNGMAQAIIKAHASGKTVIGICGGYQMMGTTVSDPDGIEGGCECMPGLGLIGMHTTMKAEKTTRQVEFTFNGARCKGYEIHQGVSTATEQVTMEGNCIGTYIHGFFDNPAVVESLIGKIGAMGHISPISHIGPISPISPITPIAQMDAFKDKQYDLLADHLRRHIDMDRLYEIITRSDD